MAQTLQSIEVSHMTSWTHYATILDVRKLLVARETCITRLVACTVVPVGFWLLLDEIGCKEDGPPKTF